MTLAAALRHVMRTVGDPTGQCYCAAEAVYHLVGGKKAGLHPARMPAPPGTGYATHWYLIDAAGNVIDPTVAQFRAAPDYTQGRGGGFLTKQPSWRARLLMEK